MVNNIEKRLAEEKQRFDQITAPENFEARMREALKPAKQKHKPRKLIWNLTAAAVLLVFFAGYQYDAFAFYGKKLLGFDDLVTGTLNDLNEKGMGQLVGKKTALSNGTFLIIDGVITDENQLVLYYTLKNSDGIDGEFSPRRLTGFFTNSIAGGGTERVNDLQTEIKGVMSFDSVSPFSKKLTLHYSEQLPNNEIKEGEVTFPYHPDEALQTGIKQSIRKTAEVDKGKITFRSITATPTVTVVEGTINADNFDRVSSALDGIELLADGKPVQMLGGGHSSSLKGRTFDLRFDALPSNLESLEIAVKQFAGYKTLDEKINIATVGAEPIPLGDTKELIIKDVTATSEGVKVTIATDVDVMLDGVSISNTNGVKTPLKTTVNQTKMNKNGTFYKQRTLLFDTSVLPEFITIKGMHYMKTYNQTIPIPL